MKLLEGLASVFIDFFGITRPTEKARRRASWFIFGMMVLALLLVFGVGGLFWRVLKH